MPEGPPTFGQSTNICGTLPVLGPTDLSRCIWCSCSTQWRRQHGVSISTHALARWRIVKESWNIQEEPGGE
eukprot:1567436-Prorocentrum_lima.AAC.1